MAYRVPKRRPDREPPTARIIGALLVLCVILMPVIGFLTVVYERYQLHGNLQRIVITSIVQKPSMVSMIPLIIAVPVLMVAIAFDCKPMHSRVIRWAYSIAALLMLAAIYLFLSRTPLVAV